MKIAIASDHGAYFAKLEILIYLRAKGHEITDFGTNSPDSCDFPDFGIPAAKAVAESKYERGILLCTNGIGMSMLANKIPGILAALVYSHETAVETRKHHDSNIICLGGGKFPYETLIKWIETWLSTEFIGYNPSSEKYLRRIKKVLELEK